MYNVYLHGKNNIQKYLKKIIGLLCLFVLFSFYKNGINVYNYNHKVFSLLSPFLMFAFTLVISIVFSKIKKESIISNRLLNNILIYLVTFPNTNILIYCILLLLINVFYRKLKFNSVALYMIVYSLINLLFHNYTFLNLYEIGTTHNYTVWDLILDKGKGGMGTAFPIFSAISLIVLLLDPIYKREIPITSLVTYYGLVLIMCFIKNAFLTDLVLNNNIIFALIFIAPLSVHSSYTKNGMLLYSIFIGTLTFAITFIDVDFGIYVAIFVASLFTKVFDKIPQKKLLSQKDKS